jgi:rhamnogalacturonyl hydrolase YesR
MSAESPLHLFRARSLQSDPLRHTTGWEDVLVPYGLARAGHALGDAALLDWAHRWFEHHHKAGYREETPGRFIASLDGTQGHIVGDYCGNWAGPLVFASLHRARPDPRYLEATRTVCDALLRQAIRLSDGVFAHGGWKHGRRTVWVDTLFYSGAVLAEACAITGDKHYAEEAVAQSLQHLRLLQDPATGGIFHDIEPATGVRSAAFWARGNGWILLSLVDVLRHCPHELPGWSELLERYRKLVTALLRLQHPCGLWRIVPENAESHLETSGSAMILAGLAGGLSNGWLEPNVRGPILRGWNELQTWIDHHGVLQGAQRPAGCGGWETHKHSTLGECTYANGLLWRLVADLSSAGLLAPSAFQSNK